MQRGPWFEQDMLEMAGQQGEIRGRQRRQQVVGPGVEIFQQHRNPHVRGIARDFVRRRTNVL